MSLAAALKAIARGTIVDGKTIAALLYYDRFGGRSRRAKRTRTGR
jgi:hypothetical protein